MVSKVQDSRFFKVFLLHFKGMDKRRVQFLYLLVRAISSVGTINLVKVAIAIQNDVSRSSNYRRIQRFIAGVSVNFDELIPFIIRLAGVQDPYTLLLDRTNWQFGRADINFLVLSVKGQSWSVPILWTLLPKKGSSNCEERIALMDRLIRIIGHGKIHSLIADREFVGQKWIRYLNEHGIPYDIRIRENMKVFYRGTERRVSTLFSRLQIGKVRTIKKPVILKGEQVFLQGKKITNTKNHREEYLIVISYDHPEHSLCRYGERWYIENMFKDLKSNGFNLECTHVTKTDRLETLMLVLAIAYTWMIRIGKFIHEKHPQRIQIKKHGRRSKSIFRLGLDEFMNTIFLCNLVRMRTYINFLSCT